MLAAGSLSAANVETHSKVAIKQIVIMIAKIFFIDDIPFCLFYGTGSTFFCYDTVSISYGALQKRYIV
jgi:hypothetical protein